MLKKYRIGYTQGAYDMFHIGHLNLLHQAKELCDILLVGINSDKLIQEYKNKTPVVNELERMEIVKEMRCVDDVFLCHTLNKTAIWEKKHFDVIFIGSDWKGNARWKQTEEDLRPLGVDVIYLKYTEGICSTQLRPLKSQCVSDEMSL